MQDAPPAPSGPGGPWDIILSAHRDQAARKARLDKARESLCAIAKSIAQARAEQEKAIDALALHMSASSLRILRQNAGRAFSWGSVRDHHDKPLGFGSYYRTFLWHEPGDGSGFSWMFAYRVWFAWKNEPDDATLLKDSGCSAETIGRRLKASMAGRNGY